MLLVYIGICLQSILKVDPRLTWSTHIDQVRRKRPETGSVGTSPKQDNGLFIRTGVLLYKQLIRPMMDYACPVWRSAVRSQIRKLQVL
jgi:hypothetical protein